MDEHEQANKELIAMFRRDQAEDSPTRKKRRRLGLLAHPWLVAVVVVVLILGPVAFIVIYPRFGPLDTMTSFCRAESNGDYASAYALLSKRAQQRESLSAFTQASSNTVLISCSVTHGVPFIFGGTQSSLDVTYQLANNDNATEGAMSFVREHGDWRVDSMSPDYFNFSS